MISRNSGFASTCLLLIALLYCSALWAQSHKPRPKPQQKIMTNADVIKMVQSKLPESVIRNAIQSKPSKFKTSASDLIELQKAGATEAEMNAIMAAASSQAQPTAAAAPPVPLPASASSQVPAPAQGPAVPAGSSAAAAGKGSSTAPALSRLPRVTLIAAGSSQDLPLEKTQLAQTKTKPTSMTSLAGDTAVTQAFQVGIGTATTSVASHIRSAAGNSSVQQAGTIFSGIMTHRKPIVTYVWGVPNPASANVLQTVSPAFAIDFSRMPGVKPDDYDPAIVKLTPAQNTCRIVGATQGKQDASSDPAADWQIYSHFLEERVPSQAEKLAPGKYKLSPASELPPGEYAVVFRPTSKSKGFVGGDVARGQGDGLMFDAVWSFQIADSAQ